MHDPFSHTLTCRRLSVTGIALIDPLRVAETVRCNSPCKLAHTLSYHWASGQGRLGESRSTGHDQANLNHSLACTSPLQTPMKGHYSAQISLPNSSLHADFETPFSASFESSSGGWRMVDDVIGRWTAFWWGRAAKAMTPPLALPLMSIAEQAW